MDGLKVTTPEQLMRGHVSEVQMATPMVGVDVEVARAVASTQAAMLMAFKNPRKEVDCWKRMKRTCGRLRFAERSLFAYKRGTSLLMGPTIRLAECLASSWRNLDYGFKVIDKTANGFVVQAYCYDLEANLRVAREFFVTDRRYTGSGELKSERDLYENIASVAQRRVRSVVIECMPIDFVDDAEAAVKTALINGDGRPFQERVDEALRKFWEGPGINTAQIEDFLGHNIRSITPIEIPKLQAVYTSITSGMGQRENFFKMGLGTPQNQEKAPRGRDERKDSPRGGSPPSASPPREQNTAGSAPPKDDRPKYHESAPEQNTPLADTERPQEDGGMTPEDIAAAEEAEREEAANYEDEERTAISEIDGGGPEEKKEQMELKGQPHQRSSRSRLK